MEKLVKLSKNGKVAALSIFHIDCNSMWTK